MTARLTPQDRELCKLTGINPQRLLAHKQRVGSPHRFTPSTRSMALDEDTVRGALAAIRKGDTKSALRILEQILAAMATGTPTPEEPADVGPESFARLTSADRALCKLLGTNPADVAKFKAGNGPRATASRTVAHGRGDRVRMRGR